MNDIYEVVSDYELEEGELTDDSDCVLISNNVTERDERSIIQNAVIHRESSDSKVYTPEKNSLRSRDKVLPRRYSVKTKTDDRECNHKKRKKRSSCNKKRLNHKVKLNSFKYDNTPRSLKNKSAFKNFSSPPRKALTCTDNQKSPLSTETELCTINSKNGNQVLPLICNKDNSQYFLSDASQVTNDNIGKEDDSDDEEELRRIALSSIAKTKEAIVSKAENGLKSTDDYEIVDMDIDSVECMQNDSEKDSNENVDNNPKMVHNVENLVFKIGNSSKCDEMSTGHNSDSSPLVDKVSGNKLSLCNDQKHSSNFEKSRNSNEEFEEQLLRAELISSMIARKKEKNVQSVVLQKVVPEMALLCSKKPKIFKRDVKDLKSSTYSKSPLVKYANFSLKRAVNNANIGQSKFKSRYKLRSVPGVTEKPVPEKVVINLNNESSSEESEAEIECSVASSEASIHALIFNARQESDLGNSSLNDNKNVSKAEQEEFNSLQKILAEKDKIMDYESVKTQTKQYSNVNILSKKITNAANDLINEVKIMNNIQNELFAKKQIYMSSKLKVQHLKEQLHSAETLRTLNLESWKKCAAKLDVLKQSVLQRENLITLLRTQLNNVTYNKTESNS